MCVVPSPPDRRVSYAVVYSDLSSWARHVTKFHSQRRSRTRRVGVTSSVHEHSGQNPRWASFRRTPNSASFRKHALLHYIEVAIGMALGRRKRNCFGASHFDTTLTENASRVGSAWTPSAPSSTMPFAMSLLNATAHKKSVVTHACNISVTTPSEPHVLLRGSKCLACLMSATVRAAYDISSSVMSLQRSISSSASAGGSSRKDDNYGKSVAGPKFDRHKFARKWELEARS